MYWMYTFTCLLVHSTIHWMYIRCRCVFVDVLCKHSHAHCSESSESSELLRISRSCLTAPCIVWQLCALASKHHVQCTMCKFDRSTMCKYDRSGICNVKICQKWIQDSGSLRSGRRPHRVRDWITGHIIYALHKTTLTELWWRVYGIVQGWCGEMKCDTAASEELKSGVGGTGHWSEGSVEISRTKLCASWHHLYFTPFHWSCPASEDLTCMYFVDALSCQGELLYFISTCALFCRRGFLYCNSTWALSCRRVYFICTSTVLARCPAEEDQWTSPAATGPLFVVTWPNLLYPGMHRIALHRLVFHYIALHQIVLHCILPLHVLCTCFRCTQMYTH